MADSVGCGISLLCRLECSCTHEMEPAGGIFWVFAWGNTLICFACFGEYCHFFMRGGKRLI